MIDKINIADNRIEGKTNIEQAKLVMLRILRVVDEICVKEGIDYWLDSGTLLGAVRHKGFIPWDDDIDIAMPRIDIPKFERALQKYIPNDMFYQTYKTDLGRKSFIIKIRDRYSSFVSSNSFANEHKGIFIDIFAMDYVKRNRLLAVVKYFYPINNKVCLPLKALEKLMFPVLKVLAKKLSLQAIETFFFKNNVSKNDAKLISYGLGAQTIKAHKFESVFPLKRMIFEGFEFNVPNNTDDYLTLIYGDYMTLPPVEEQVNKHADEILPFTACKHKESIDWNTRK